MKKHLHFSQNVLVTGNQAADLDSAVSASGLACLLQALNPHVTVDFHIQGSMEDLRLKPEIPAVFKHAAIPLLPKHFDSKLFSGRAVFLVDHNVPDIPGMTMSIAGILDHHRDEGLFTELPFRKIASCASCASLVSRLWKDSGEGCPYSFSLALASAIALDSGYLNPELGKTTDLDRDEYIRHFNRLVPEDQQFLRGLLDLKNNLEGLGLADLLQRDYKAFPLENLKGGSSSVPLGTRDFFKEDFFSQKAVVDFMEDKNLDFLLLIHSAARAYSRELSFYAPKPCMEELWLQSVQLLKEGKFQKQVCPPGWHSFIQGNSLLSRKRLIPLFKDILVQLQLMNPAGCQSVDNG